MSLNIPQHFQQSQFPEDARVKFDRFFEGWKSLSKDDDILPFRRDINPAVFRDLLANVLLLDLSKEGVATIDLMAANLQNLSDRNYEKTDIYEIYNDEDAALLKAGVPIIRQTPCGYAHTFYIEFPEAKDDFRMHICSMGLPVKNAEGEVAYFLGLTMPLTTNKGELLKWQDYSQSYEPVHTLYDQMIYIDVGFGSHRPRMIRSYK